MKTAYYMLTTQDALPLGENLEKAAGGERQAVWIRQPGQRAPQGGVPGNRNNVVDLAAWKARREQEAADEDRWMDGADEEWSEAEELNWLLAADESAAAPARRPRREHPTLPLRELAATLSVAGATAAMILWALAF